MPSNQITSYKISSANYQAIPIVQLVELITKEADRNALQEFHNNRKIFHLDTGDHMVMTEFINTICNSPGALSLAGYNYNLLEKTYDHLIDRFSNIPDDRYPDGPDCRYYFNAFLDHIYNLFEQKGLNNPLQKEVLVAKTMQSMVIRHFKYSLKESSRSQNPLRTRYQWDINGGSIMVWMPVFKSGSDRRKWLNKHIDNPNPSKPGERYRIQKIIDTELGTPAIHDFEYSDDLIYSKNVISNEDSLPGMKEIDIKGLASAVADEKTDNISSMRPAIKTLGRQKLGDLIRCIFQDISYDNYEEKSTAQKFGISRATLSRFAGSRWRISAFERCPDLWSNLARVLAGSTVFTEAAKQYGIWDKVLSTIEIKG